MAKYKLSVSAELDLLNIAVYGMEQFGLAQAELYRDKLQCRFEELATSPLHYPAVDFVREGAAAFVVRIQFTIASSPTLLRLCALSVKKISSDFNDFS